MLGAIALAGCGGGDGAGGREPGGGAASGETPTAARAPAARAPALCRGARARVIGRIRTPAATELSGLVLSRSQPDVLWTHNDSGDGARVLAVGFDGRLLADVPLDGAQHVDWEDLAAARGTLLIGDIGDNLARRPSVTVYRVAEPRVAGATTTASAPAAALAEPIELRYPDGPRDAEALLRDPSSGALVIVEKRFDGRAGIYVAQRPAPGAVLTLRRRGSVSLGPGQAVTAGDVSADGRTIALRSYDRAFVWARRRGEPVAQTLQRRPCIARSGLLVEGQGEALALSAAGGAFYTVPEGARPQIRRYAPR